MKGAWIAIALACAALHPATVSAKEAPRTSPEAGSRTYLQNFKDMVLAQCLATAYEQAPAVSKDIGSSTNALRDWTYYDLERAPDVVHALVAKYLARDYRNPIVESEVRVVRFDYLKCMDLYHGKELDAAAKKLVLRPNSTYRAENPR
ncbi:type VI secretion system amidase immunity protein Tai4 [Burkholderia sp. JKS000303]|uniref:type VI secretion system amidase immunity protein Tai4 n=1 Tax=Burkholderia sp. JKS000303 TaxID=1938747 RepID=UPI000BF9BD92|nr:type VI secretion system amidase immunity protein Tai4 [Burkholderia sp. JKS000303]PFH29975.1 type VI secretion system (T6SS) amidase immunity protein Tai4 [Burkholderia sp. JKS000303]